MQALLEMALGILYGIEGFSPNGEGKEFQRTERIRRRLHVVHRAVCVAKFVVLVGLAVLAFAGEVH